MITNTNYIVTPEQTGMVMAIQNKECVADQVMPIKKLNTKSTAFKYAERNLGDGFTIPSTLIGRKSVPNQVNFSMKEQSGVCVDYGLGEVIPQRDIEESDGQVGNLVSDGLEAIMNLVLLDREVRVAKIVQSASNYLPSKVITTKDEDKFSNLDSKPLEYILELLDKSIVRPNRMVIGQQAWTKLRMNPSIVKAMHGNAGDSGVASRQVVAELLELQEIIVGTSFVNTSKQGKEPTLERCWDSNIVAFHYYEPVANSSLGIAWGMTFQAGDRFADTTWDSKIGALGAYVVKAGACWAEKVTAKGAGMLLTGVLS
jgi:hypothetical protein